MPQRLLFLVLLCAALALAAAPVATVTNSAGLALNGNKLAVTGVSSWPLVAGDSLATTASTAVIMFPDHSRLVLEKNSRVKLARDGDKLLVRLLEGALLYKLASGSRVHLEALGRPLTPPAAVEGKLSIVGKQLVETALPPGSSAPLADCCPPPPKPSKFR